MKTKLFAAMMVACLCAGTASAQGLMDRMMNRSGCGECASTCCDTPADTCGGCNSDLFSFNMSFSIPRPNLFNRCGGCGRSGRYFGGGMLGGCGSSLLAGGDCGCDTGYVGRCQADVPCYTGCDSGCETGCNGGLLSGGMLSGRSFGNRMMGCGCGNSTCATPVNDACGCRGGLLSGLRARFSGMGMGGCGCETSCDPCGQTRVRMRRFGGSSNCGCNDPCQTTGCPGCGDSTSMGVTSGCGCSGSVAPSNSAPMNVTPTPAAPVQGAVPAPAVVEPQADPNNAQPSPSDNDSTSFNRINGTQISIERRIPTAPIVDPSAFITPGRVIGSGR